MSKGYEAGVEDKEHSREEYTSFDPAFMEFSEYRAGYAKARAGAAYEYMDEWRPDDYYDDDHPAGCNCFFCRLDWSAE